MPACTGNEVKAGTLPREIDYISVSIANGCRYCVHSRTAAARSKGMTNAQRAERMAVIGLVAKTNPPGHGDAGARGCGVRPPLTRSACIGHAVRRPHRRSRTGGLPREIGQTRLEPEPAPGEDVWRQVPGRILRRSPLRPPAMTMNTAPTLELLITEVRSNGETDVEFAQRVALICVHLLETKQDPVAAIRTTFRIQ